MNEVIHVGDLFILDSLFQGLSDWEAKHRKVIVVSRVDGNHIYFEGLRFFLYRPNVHRFATRVELE